MGAAAAVNFLANLAGGEPIVSSAPDASGGHEVRRERLAAVFRVLHERGLALCKQLLEGLGAIDGVRLFGPPPSAPRTPTVSLIVRGIPAAEVCTGLARRGVFASHGNFYAQTVADRLGQSADGLVRLGCACYTTEDEINRVIETVHDIARRQH